MCIYIQMVPLCGHPPPTLLSYSSCDQLLAQLLRINAPEAWDTPASRAAIPFEVPRNCDPRLGVNIVPLYSDGYCGWECRNNAYFAKVQQQRGVGEDESDDEEEGVVERGGGGGMLPAYMPGDESRYGFGVGAAAFPGDKRPMVMGLPDARYGPGSERLGIGWRSH